MLEVLVLGDGLPALVPFALPSALEFAPVIFFAMLYPLLYKSPPNQYSWYDEMFCYLI
jgi:hypothetical protein